MAGISRTSALFTRTVTANRLPRRSSSSTPAGLSSGTVKCVGGSAPGPESGGRLTPVSGPSPRTRMVSSSGSPAETTVRLASVSMAKPLPMAPAKDAGRFACGSGRTTIWRRWPRALNNSRRARGNPNVSRTVPVCRRATT